MITRSYKAVTTRPILILAALLATLALLAPAVFAAESIEYQEGRTDAVAIFSASDEDDDPIDWTRTGDDADAFEINEDASGNGVLTFKKSPGLRESW